MLQSKLFPGTLKEDPRNEFSKSSKLLVRAGYIDKVMAGVYNMLPLGWRTLTKIEDIVREEMDAIGGQEVFLPSLSPRENWIKTGRMDTVDVLFQAQGANKFSREKNDAEYVLNSTHEEIVTPLAKKFRFSYKDFPLALYQIQTKFRNEPRPKSGILRGREFRMKDLYSFHGSEKDLLEFYEKSKEAYMNVFKRLGLGEDTYVTLASGGDFTKDFSHEFQTRCPAGEDLVFRSAKKNICYNREIAPSRAPAKSEKEKEKEKEKVLTEGTKTVDTVTKLLGLEASKIVKTLIFKKKKGFAAAALRGDYELNQEKLEKVLGGEVLVPASAEEIKELTGTEPGYIGLVGLPEDLPVYFDDSLENEKNLVTGANEKNHHFANVNFGRDVEKPDEFYDIKMAKEEDFYPETGEKYETFKASEVGNIFPLNVKFSKAFDYYYTDKNGEKQIVYMGSYGIGPTRLMGVIVEKFNDEKGIVWPENIAPYQVHLISIGKNDEASKLYSKLKEEGVEVLYDDREGVSPGQKFAEADLLGCPYRVVISEKTLKEGKLELKKRSEREVEMVNEEELIKSISKLKTQKSKPQLKTKNRDGQQQY
ncbi:MAG: proline--tRNA ligase [Candidatus Moranbacteria bacterium]|nr:proline--tRNA ligase [Candidatus Moranbacteria bacterium]